MIYPKIVRGGNAIPIGDNLFLMKGRKHKNGGIDIGKDLEVEGGEVMQTSPNEIKVFSAQKFLGGESPAELILSGANPDRVFAAQEQYKDAHGINDDGSKKKAKNGGLWQRFVNFINGNKNDSIQTPVKGESLTEEERQTALTEYFNDVKSRQLYAESKYDTNIKNSKDAYGAFQIRPIAVAQYNKLTGENILHNDVLNFDIASKVRDTLMDYYWNRPWINKAENENDSVRMVKTLMAYNMGEGNALQELNRLKEAGINIYNTDELLKNISNTEARNYAGFVATGKNQKDKLYLNDSIYQIYRKRYKDLDDKSRTYKQYGGMTNKENNANILGYVPSTGKRKKALMGSDGKEYTDVTQMPVGVNPKLHDLDWSDSNAYKAPTYDLNSISNSTNNNDESNQDEEDILAGQKKLKTDYWLATGLGALGRTAAGVTGAIINNATNKKYLGKMEELVKGMKTFAAPTYKLKTNYDINPQLGEIENQLGLYTRDVNANTVSSSAALNRLRNARAAAVLQKNKLYGIKENEETKLINQDILNQQQQMQRIAENEQNVYNTKQQLLANLADKRAENASATTQNIIGSVVGGIDTILNGTNAYAQMLAGMAKSPNGANAIYGNIGKQQRERKVKKKNNDKNVG